MAYGQCLAGIDVHFRDCEQQRCRLHRRDRDPAVLNQILNVLGPIFFGMGLGYLAGKTRELDNRHVADLNALVMDFALPIAIFATIAAASRVTLLGQLPLAGILTASMLVLFGATYAIARWADGFDAPEASIQALTIAVPNYASAGLPLIAALLGPKELVSVAVAIACGCTFVSPITLVVLDACTPGKESSMVRSLASAYRKPIVLAPMIAVAVVLVGLPVPTFVQKSLSLMGEVSGGATLFLTGLIVSAQPLKPDTNVAIQTGLANVVHPLLAAGLAWLFAVDGLARREAVVLSALPVGFFGILFGLRFKRLSKTSGTTLIASTVLSAATLSAVIYLTASMGRP